MNSISKTEALIYLVAYQNQGTIVDYLDPWIGMWTNDFILTGLSNSLHLKILEAGFDEDELEEVVQNQPDIHNSSFGIEKELLKEWTDWIMRDNQRKSIIKADLEGYFYWHGKPWWETPENEDIPWYTEEGMPRTPQEALDWFGEVFGEDIISEKNKLSDGKQHLGWIDDAKKVEVEECLMKFYDDLNSIPKNLTKTEHMKNVDNVLHHYSDKLISMIKETTENN